MRRTHLMNLCLVHIIILQIEIIIKVMEANSQARLVMIHLWTKYFIWNCVLFWISFGWYGGAWSWLASVLLYILGLSSCCCGALLSHLSVLAKLIGNLHIFQIIVEVVRSAELRQGLPQFQIDIALAYDLGDVCCITEFFQILPYGLLNLTFCIQIWSNEALTLWIE